MAWGSDFKSCDALLKRIEANDPKLAALTILPTKTFGDAELNRVSAVFEAGTNTHLKILHCSGHACSESSLRRFGLAIAAAGKDCPLEDLAVGHGDMGDAGVCAFCEGLTGANSLKRLDLSFKGMTSTGFQALLKCLGHGSSLQELDISRNPDLACSGLTLGDSLLSSVQDLNMADCGIDSSFAADFFPKLLVAGRELTLRLSGNALGGDGFKSLWNPDASAKLTKVYLSKCKLGDKSMEFLNSLKTSLPVTVLDLSSNNLSSLGAHSLSACLSKSQAADTSCLGHVVDLTLTGNPLGDEGVVGLVKGLNTRQRQGLAPLNELDLSQTKCGVAGAVAAVQESHAAALRLFDNNLCSVGFQALATTICGGHKSMTSLDLAGNRAEQAAVVELLGALLVQDEDFVSVLQTLIIGGNQGGLEVEAMAKRVQEVRPGIDIARDKIQKQKA